MRRQDKQIYPLFCEYYSRIRERMYGLYHVLSEDKNIVSREHFIDSVLSLSQTYIYLTPTFGSEHIVVDHILLICTTCFWIVDKWENDQYHSATTYKLATDYSRTAIRQMELNIMKKFNFQICPWMPGLTPSSPKHNNELAPVMEELLVWFDTRKLTS